MAEASRAGAGAGAPVPYSQGGFYQTTDEEPVTETRSPRKAIFTTNMCVVALHCGHQSGLWLGRRRQRGGFGHSKMIL
jgi:hypothetical protein